MKRAHRAAMVTAANVADAKREARGAASVGETIFGRGDRVAAIGETFKLGSVVRAWIEGEEGLDFDGQPVGDPVEVVLVALDGDNGTARFFEARDLVLAS